MFHNSTTLHHCHIQFIAVSKESRLVHLNWFATKRLQASVFWDYMRPLRRVAKIYSWGLGWPLITRGADATMKLLGRGVDRVEWAGYVASESAQGAFQMTATPLGMLVKSRLEMVKNFLWDVPIASFSAAIRTPIALAKSPFTMISGVRDAIKSVPGNVKEILNSVSQFKLMDTLKNTRKAVTDLFLPPFTKPAKSVLTPPAQLGGAVVKAHMLTPVAAYRAATEVIPEGFNRIKNSTATADAIMLEKARVRAAAKAVLETEKEANKEAWEAQKAESIGRAADGGKGGGGKGGGGGGGMKMAA